MVCPSSLPELSTVGAVEGWYGFYRGSVPDVLGLGGVLSRAEAGGLPQTVRTLGTLKKEAHCPMIEGRLALWERLQGCKSSSFYKNVYIPN